MTIVIDRSDISAAAEIELADKIIEAVKEAAPDGISLIVMAALINRLISTYGLQGVAPHIFNAAMALQRIDEAEWELIQSRASMQ